MASDNQMDALKYQRQVFDQVFDSLFMPRRKQRKLEEVRMQISLLGRDWSALVRFYAEYEQGDEYGPGGWTIDVDSVSIEPADIHIQCSRPIEVAYSEFGSESVTQVEEACLRYMEGK